MNTFISTVIIAPMTTNGRNYPSRVSCRFAGKDGQIVLDQIRTVDKMKLVKNVGKLDRKTQKAVLEILQEMFSE